MSILPSNIHFKYYLGIGFLIIAIVGSYIIIDNKQTSQAATNITKAHTDETYIDYEFNLNKTSDTGQGLFTIAEKSQKIQELEHKRTLFVQDLQLYNEQYNKYNNRTFILNKKKNTVNKQKYTDLINKTQREIDLIDKQLHFLKKP